MHASNKKELNKNPFLKEEIVFKNSWKKLSIDDINEAVPLDFPKKKEFMDFYLTTNGGCLTKGAYIYRDNFYETKKNDYNVIEVSSFFHIPLIEDDEDSEYTLSIPEAAERREGYSNKFDKFVLFHIPFADNFGDNDFWIDVQTGEVKYIDYEECDNPDDAILIAPSFIEFCEHLQAKRR